MATAEESRSLLTRMLQDWRSGDEDALDRLTPLVYDELYRLARAKMGDERSGHLLQPSALVNETFVRLLNSEPMPWASRVHFFAHSARLMRQILTDFARGRDRQKRMPESQRILLSSLDALAADRQGSNIDFLDLDAALDELKKLHARQARVVELRYFGGLEADEIGEVLQIAPATVTRDWRAARAWLFQRLGPSPRD